MSRAGWQPLRRGAWSGKVLVLKRERPDVFSTWAWLHQCPLVGPVPGVLVSSAVSLPALLASHLEETPEQIAEHLQVLEARGLVLVDGADLYLPALLGDTCSAPTSNKQVPSWARQVRKLGATLRERVTRDLLAITALADEERGRRRKPGTVPILHLLQEALGIRLVALPQPAQLPLPIAAPPPGLQLISEPLMPDSSSSLSRGAAPTHAGSSPRCDRQRPAPRQGGSELEELGQCWLALLGEQPKDVAPQTGDAQAATAERSVGLRAGSNEGLRAQLVRFIELSKDSGGVARVLVAELDEQAIYQLDEAVRRVRAEPQDLDEMARLLASGEEWGFQRGVTLEMLCRKPFRTHQHDHFRALLLKARTPARKPQAKSGGMPQPALSQHDDLGDVFAVPRRSAK